MNEAHYARPHHSYERDYNAGPSEYVNHTSPRTSFRRIRNFFRRRSSGQARPPMSVDYPVNWSSPLVNPYTRAGLADPVPNASPSYRNYHNTYQNGAAHTVSAESEDVPSSFSYPPTPRIPYLRLPWIVPDTWKLFERIELTCPINSNRCLLILHHCDRLAAFKFTLAMVEGDSVAPSHVEARDLRSLTIDSSCGTGRLFESLGLPELTSLHLSLAPLDDPPIDIGLESLISRSARKLNALSLINVFLPEDELMASLEMASSLRELVVRNDRSCPGMWNGRMISGHIISDLTRNGGTTKCPHLRTLELSPCFSRDGLLGAMVTSRLRSLPSDFNFTYSFLYPSLHTYDIQSLDVLKANNPRAHLAQKIVIHEL